MLYVCKLFTPQYTALQNACSIQHALDYAKLKKAQSKAELNKMRNEKVSEESINALLKTTKDTVHRYVRERDKGKPCISCGATWHNRFQAGHCFSVKQHNGIRFDLFNINGQCPKCNTFNEGNYDEYRLRLPNRIGVEEFEKLKKRAKIALVVPYSYTKHELREILLNIKILKSEME